MMQRCLFALAGASVAMAAPAIEARQVGVPVPDVAGAAVGAAAPVTDAVTSVTAGAPLAVPAVDLPTLLAGILGNVQTLKFRGSEMSQEEIEAMEQIEDIIAEVREELESMEAPKVQARQLEILSGLLSSLGLGNLLGKVNINEMNAQESEMMREASDIVMNLAEELKTEVVALEKTAENKVHRRQLDLLYGLPIVGPLLQSILGGILGGGGAGGIIGGVTGGATGGLGGTLGGVTGGLGGTLGGVTGTLGGLTGGLGGLTGGLTGTLGGLTGGLGGGLLGKVKVEDVKITDEQMAMARKAEDLFNKLDKMLEKTHAQ